MPSALHLSHFKYWFYVQHIQCNNLFPSGYCCLSLNLLLLFPSLAIVNVCVEQDFNIEVNPEKKVNPKTYYLEKAINSVLYRKQKKIPDVPHQHFEKCSNLFIFGK